MAESPTETSHSIEANTSLLMLQLERPGQKRLMREMMFGSSSAEQ